ncbi:hypothetical protein F5Y10DRAFT_255153 [Nemania abortiva]|nr:hypothetical protein F5Y10DRAFT_255153 [Nemania abortiva]
MQVVGLQPTTDKQHDNHSLVAYGVGNIPLRGPAVPGHDHDFWVGPESAWPLDSLGIDHQTANHYGYSREQPLTGTDKIDYYPAANFQVPSEEWPIPNFALEAAYDRYGDPTTPSIATPYSPTSQNNFGALPEAGEHRDEVERDNDSLSPMPTSPDNGPNTHKRHRNRLAAAKCRRKAKRGVDELQQRERDLLRENKMLSAEAGFLREEVLQLKREILRHSGCNNDCIRQYIQRAAEQVGRAQSDNSTFGIPVMPATNCP